jgi:Restriction endonuclease
MPETGPVQPHIPLLAGRVAARSARTPPQLTPLGLEHERVSRGVATRYRAGQSGCPRSGWQGKTAFPLVGGGSVTATQVALGPCPGAGRFWSSLSSSLIPLPRRVRRPLTDGESSQAGSETPGDVSPTVTRVPWRVVTGAQLEELLHGLLDAMGASSLVWRAGSATGVTASDGGRDLEAVFDRPSPDGELDRQRWWIESKGRTRTVEPSAVQEAVLNAAGRTDIDVLVVATNSRFSNPTRDWIEEWARSHPRPLVKLWDKGQLDRLVRRYPTVVARTFPQALDDKERLELLTARFFEFGERPTEQDLNYFWERRDWLAAQESGIFCRAVAMFLYVEGVPLQRIRQWWRLLRAVSSRDATGSASSGCSRRTAISARQSSPSATAAARSATILPGWSAPLSDGVNGRCADPRTAPRS